MFELQLKGYIKKLHKTIMTKVPDKSAIKEIFENHLLLYHQDFRSDILYIRKGKIGENGLHMICSDTIL